jgi:hypothetical protein
MYCHISEAERLTFRSSPKLAWTRSLVPSFSLVSSQLHNFRNPERNAESAALLHAFSIQHLARRQVTGNASYVFNVIDSSSWPSSRHQMESIRAPNEALFRGSSRLRNDVPSSWTIGGCRLRRRPHYCINTCRDIYFFTSLSLSQSCFLVSDDLFTKIL